MNRRAAKAGRPGKITPEELLELIQQYDSSCAYCLKKLNFNVSSSGKHPDDATFDHVLSLGNGGTGNKDNLVPCCLRCNATKAKSEGRRFEGGDA